MKKLLIMAVALLTAGVASAQITYSIGYVHPTSKVSYEEKLFGQTLSGSYDYKLNGFTISVDDNINLAGGFNVAPGLGMYLAFGSYQKTDLTKFGLYVPVDFNYGFALGSDVKLFIYAGPTFDLGLVYNGKPEKGDKESMYKEDKGNLSRFDLLLGFGGWVTFKDQYRLKAGYNLGLLNTCKTDNITMKNNVFSVSVGYVF